MNRKTLSFRNIVPSNIKVACSVYILFLISVIVDAIASHFGAGIGVTGVWPAPGQLQSGARLRFVSIYPCITANL